jgi:hypothetical protein
MTSIRIPLSHGWAYIALILTILSIIESLVFLVLLIRGTLVRKRFNRLMIAIHLCNSCYQSIGLISDFTDVLEGHGYLRVTSGIILFWIAVITKYEILGIFESVTTFPLKQIRIWEIISSVYCVFICWPTVYQSIVQRQYSSWIFQIWVDYGLVVFIVSCVLFENVVTTYLLWTLYQATRHREFEEYRRIQFYFLLILAMDVVGTVLWIIGYVEMRREFVRSSEAYAGIHMGLLTLCFETLKHFTFRNPRKFIQNQVATQDVRELPTIHIASLTPTSRYT